MIRLLRPTDSARVLLFRPSEGGTQAFTLDSAAHPAVCRYRPARYVARALTWRARRDAWIAFGNPGVTGVASVRHRNGPTVWEVTELFLSQSARTETDGAELLADLADAAARAAIQRVFLRIEDGSPMATAARRAGYMLQTRETLYRRPEDLRGQDQNQRHPGESGWRPVREDDLHSVFRLYGASTPLAVRECSGMTLPEWREALEPMPHPSRGANAGEMLLDGGDRPVAWVRYSDASNERLFTLLIEPEAQIDPAEVVRGVLSGGYGIPAATLVPLYAHRAAVALEEAGFVPGHDYELFSRPTAERAKIPQNAMVAAGG